MEPVILSWLLSRGIRLDDHLPDERRLAHLRAVHDAKREANQGTTWFTRLARRIGLQSVPATTAPASCACASVA